MIRFSVERRVLVLEIRRRIGPTGRVQPSDSRLRREPGLLLEILKNCVNKEGPPSDTILRRETRYHAIAAETQSTQYL